MQEELLEFLTHLRFERARSVNTVEGYERDLNRYLLLWESRELNPHLRYAEPTLYLIFNSFGNWGLRPDPWHAR